MNMKKLLLRLIKIIFFCLFIFVIYILISKVDLSYYLKRHYIRVERLYIIIFDIILVLLFCIFKKNRIINDKQYKWIVIILQCVIFIVQLVITLNIEFKTEWDIGIIQNIVDNYIKNGYIGTNEYLTKYPNNLLLTSILIILKKLPFIGSYYITTLIFSILLVNLSLLFISLTIRNIKANNAGIVIYLLLFLLLIINPWYVIPYSDVFCLFAISLITYLYSKKNKNNRDIFIIGFIGILFSYIKPTVLICLISILIIELIYNRNIKDYFIWNNKGKKIVILILSILIAVSTNFILTKPLKFEPISGKHSMTIFHYLNMGQSNTSFGFHNEEDEINSYNYGYKYDIKSFKKRLFGKSFIGHKLQVTNKTLMAFNDGSFAWGQYSNFFKQIKIEREKFNFLQNIYYSLGVYYRKYITFVTFIWLSILIFIPFIVFKKLEKIEYYIIINLVGIYIFLILFESYSRYLYSYVGLFSIISLLSIYNISEGINKHLKSIKKTLVKRKSKIKKGI